jgi:hypothetical protein
VAQRTLCYQPVPRRKCPTILGSPCCKCADVVGPCADVVGQIQAVAETKLRVTHTWGAASALEALRRSSVQMLSAHTLMLARYCAVACDAAAASWSVQQPRQGRLVPHSSGACECSSDCTHP